MHPVRHIQNGWDQVGRKVLRLNQAVFLNKIFENSITCGLNNGALDLALYLLRIDCPTDIVGGDYIQKMNVAGLDIYLNDDRLGNIAISEIGFGFAGLRIVGRGGRRPVLESPLSKVVSSRNHPLKVTSLVGLRTGSAGTLT